MLKKYINGGSIDRNLANILLEKICKKYVISSELADFEDLDVRPSDLPVILLPLIKHIVHAKPDIILGLSNGADPITSEIKDLIEILCKERIVEIGDYSPKYLNLIVGRKTSINVLLDMLFTEKERNSKLPQKCRNFVREQIPITIEKLQVLEKQDAVQKNRYDWYFSNRIYKLKGALCQLENLLDLTLGNIMINLPEDLVDIKSAVYHKDIFPLLLPLFEMFHLTNAAKFFSGRNIMVIDEIVYSGDALNKAFTMLKILGVTNADLGIVVDYTVAQEDVYHMDPIGGTNINKEIGINEIVFGKYGRKSKWSVVNLNLGPDYTNGKRNLDLEDLRKSVQDGYGFRQTMFAKKFIEVFLKNFKERTLVAYLNSLSEKIKTVLISEVLRQVLLEKKLSFKPSIPWKDRETKKLLKEIMGDKFLPNWLLEVLFERINDFVDKLLIKDVQSQFIDDENLLVYNLRLWNEVLVEVKNAEKIIYSDPDFKQLISIYMNSKEQLLGVMADMQKMVVNLNNEYLGN